MPPRSWWRYRLHPNAIRALARCGQGYLLSDSGLHPVAYGAGARTMRRVEWSRKLPAYFRHGVQHVWLLDPRAAELDVLHDRGAGTRYVAAPAQPISAPPFLGAVRPRAALEAAAVGHLTGPDHRPGDDDVSGVSSSRGGAFYLIPALPLPRR
jgi:hypothetical protein